MSKTRKTATSESSTPAAHGEFKHDPWEQTPSIVRRFLSQLPQYEQLCSEVAYTMTKRIEKAEIKVASITSRTKDLTSFLEKVGRKTYKDPFVEVTDFAGVRVVCYYPETLPKIEQLILTTFEIIEREDKTLTAGVDRFGYGGTHFLVRFGSKPSGARYEDLKDLACEIQVRTVMQDAWAILSHHLVYKRENDIPDVLKRRVNALAGALDSADFAFQAIREKRDEYIRSVAAATSQNELDSLPVDADSLREFLSKKFENMLYEGPDPLHETSEILGYLKRFGYTSLSDVDRLLKRTESARNWFAANHPLKIAADRTGLGEVLRALFFFEPVLRNEGTAPRFREAYEEGSALIDRSI